MGLTALAAAALAGGDLDPLAGGWHWQALVFVTREGIVAVALSLWLILWFPRRWDHQGRLAQRAGRGSYAAYVLHPPVLVVLSMLARPLPVPPEAKLVLVAITGVVASFAVGVELTRLRAVARIL